MKIPCSRKSTPEFLPRESHGQRSLVHYSPWGCKELDTIEWLSTNTHQPCIAHWLPIYIWLQERGSILGSLKCLIKMTTFNLWRWKKKKSGHWNCITPKALSRDAWKQVNETLSTALHSLQGRPGAPPLAPSHHILFPSGTVYSARAQMASPLLLESEEVLTNRPQPQTK